MAKRHCKFKYCKTKYGDDLHMYRFPKDQKREVAEMAEVITLEGMDGHSVPEISVIGNTDNAQQTPVPFLENALEEVTEQTNEVSIRKSTKKQVEPIKDTVAVGNVSSIAIQDMSRIANQTFKMSTPSINANFLYLSAGAMKLLPNKPGKSKSKAAKRAKMSSKSSLETTKESQGMGFKDARKKSGIGDGESGSETGKKSGDADASTTAENENGKRPHSPDDKSSEHSQDYEDDNRDYRSSQRYDDFYCKVCDVELNSEQTWFSHIEGKKHQKKLTVYQSRQHRPRGKSDLQYIRKREGCQINRRDELGVTPHIQQQVESLNEPCVGLNFVSEIWRLDESLEDSYFCSLCSTTCVGPTIISHVIGYKHRLAYMKLFDRVNYEKVKTLTTKKSELSAVLQTHAVNLEKTIGPGQIKVEVEVEGFVPPLQTGMRYQDNAGDSPYDLQPQFIHLSKTWIGFCRLRCMAEIEAHFDPDELEILDRFHRLEYSVDTIRGSLSEYKSPNPAFSKHIQNFVQAVLTHRITHPPTHYDYPQMEEPPMNPASYQCGRPFRSFDDSSRYGQMMSYPTYVEEGGYWQQFPQQTAFKGNRNEPGQIAATVLEVGRRHEMHAAQTENVASRFKPGISQMNIPPYPFGNEQRPQAYAPQYPAALAPPPPPPPPPAPLATMPTPGREIWAPIQSRKPAGQSIYSTGSYTSFM